jgi:hypothetical protein
MDEIQLNLPLSRYFECSSMATRYNNYMITFTNSNIVKTDLNNAKIVKNIEYSEFEEHLNAHKTGSIKISFTWRNFNLFWLDEYYLFIVANDNQIFKISVETFEISFVALAPPGCDMREISPDGKSMIISNTGKYAYLSGENVYAFRSNLDIHTDYKYIYYIDLSNKLIKYDINKKSTKVLSMIETVVHIMYLDSRIFVMSEAKTDCYDMNTLKYLYTVSCMYITDDKYIVSGLDENRELCKPEGCIHYIRLHSIIDGRQLSEFKIEPSAYLSMANNIIISHMGHPDYIKITLYRITGKKLGYILQYNMGRGNTSIISNNGKHIYYVDGEVLKHQDISDLYNCESKLEFLKGRYSPESAIARAAANPLFDEHLFGEIFSMMTEYICIGKV